MFSEQRLGSHLRQRGVTLIELVIFIVIVGIGLAGIVQMLNLSTRLSADPVRRKQALLMAEGLLEEVELARFTYCDPTDPNAATAMSTAVSATGCSSAALVEQVGQEAGGVARPFDNVNDYVKAFADEEQAFNNANGVLVDAAGNAYPGNNGNTTYKAYLTITATDKLGPAGNTITADNTPANMNTLRITVRVNYGSGSDDNIVLEGYRTRYAPTSVP
jgi:MSHA pilin protein MshD